MHRKWMVTFNSPAIIGFAALCFAAQILSVLTGGAANRLVFSVYRAPLSLLACVRCFAHVLGHADWSHLFGNMMYLLILGPMLEEKYGTKRVCIVILATALVTGILNIVLFPGTALLGASGVVFAMILLSSFASAKDGEIPITFLLVAALYIGEQALSVFQSRDNISQMAHIAGGAVGSAFGFFLPKRRAKT